jgi:hypothetical protein
MRAIKHDGTEHHGIGVRPTMPMSRTTKGGRKEALPAGCAPFRLVQRCGKVV